MFMRHELKKYRLQKSSILVMKRMNEPIIYRENSMESWLYFFKEIR